MSNQFLINGQLVYFPPFASINHGTMTTLVYTLFNTYGISILHFDSTKFALHRVPIYISAIPIQVGLALHILTMQDMIKFSFLTTLICEKWYLIIVSKYFSYNFTSFTCLKATYIPFLVNWTLPFSPSLSIFFLLIGASPFTTKGNVFTFYDHSTNGFCCQIPVWKSLLMLLCNLALLIKACPLIP